MNDKPFQDPAMNAACTEIMAHVNDETLKGKMPKMSDRVEHVLNCDPGVLDQAWKTMLKPENEAERVELFSLLRMQAKQIDGSASAASD